MAEEEALHKTASEMRTKAAAALLAASAATAAATRDATEKPNIVMLL